MRHNGNKESPGEEDPVTGTQTANRNTDTGEAPASAPVPERVKERWRLMSESAKAEEAQQAQFKRWVDNGSDDLLEAWVSVSPCANDRAVEHWRLPDIVEVIRKRSQLGVTRYERPVDVDLTEVTGKVNTLYRAGYEAALRLNAKTYARLLGMLGINATPDEVAPVVEQPKKNEKVFYLTALRVGGEEYPCERTRYHDPVAMGKDKAKDVKMKQVPGVTFAGIFDPHRDASYLYQTTGLYTLDADALDDVKAVYKHIVKDPSVVLCFRSITGSGLKIVVYGPRVSTAEEYTTVYNRIFALKGREWGIADRLDVATKDCSRLCFLSYDPDAYVNWNAVALFSEDLPDVDANSKTAPSNSTQKKESTGSSKAKAQKADATEQSSATGLPLDIDWGAVPDLKWEDISLARCLDAMRYIDPCCDRDTWRIVGAAMKLGFGDEAFAFFDLWSSHGGAAYTGPEDCRKLWDGHKREGGKVYNPPSILWLAKQNGWKSAYQRPKGAAGSAAESGIEIDEQGRILLPKFGAAFTPGDFCALLYDHMGKSRQAYLRGGQVSHLVDDPEDGTVIEKVDAASMVTWIENFAQLYVTDKEGNRRPTSIDEKSCRIIVKAAHRYELPPLESVVEAPVLCEINGKPQYVEAGYNRDLHLFVLGNHRLPDVDTLKDAVRNILTIIKDYDFATPSDKSRAVAALLTSAFKLGRFIKGHVPMPLFEADDSQSGKSMLAETVAAIHGEHATFISQRKNGVGSVDESIGKAMMKGRPFIVLDNWRGDLDSQFLECILTGGGRVDVRALRTASDVDANRYIFGVTSNGMSATKDLCNRATIIRINKRHGYNFPLFPEGCLPDHIRANFERYLASVYCVVVEWLERGRPRTQETRHSFMEWAGVLDWVVQNFFNLPPLLDGHAETLVRVAHPYLAAFRQLCLEVDRRDQLTRTIRAYDLGDMALAAHIDLGRGAAASEDGGAMAVGKIMSNSFAALRENEQRVIEFEGFFIRRREDMFHRKDGLGTKKGWAYQFSRTPFVAGWADDGHRVSAEY